MRPRSITAKCRRCPEPSPPSILAIIMAFRGENRRPQRRCRRCPPIPTSPEVRPSIPSPAQRSSGRFLLRAG
ncbi:hypothetical protein CDL15_Pgr006202 [Punica granatum]|uniref:Uncharacterized protein n=1 Tax=Punica granatum TaxID=22663 RepID=A0A218XFQ8_PUNGR|nr:hypothetical protein CDL15_Pgr006202 [Punica granatum]PKI79378.1 hypothetical protein CRG98_000224 [Punica granatum]